MVKDLKKLEKTIGVQFRNRRLLLEALSHRSFLNEHPEENLQSNERLEFLGDAVLELVVSQFLFEKFPHLPEGELTSLRSKLVCTKSLAAIAKRLNLGDYLLLSRGEEKANGATNETLLANALEAVIGALYKDQGSDQVKQFINQHLLTQSEAILSRQSLIDFKSKFQEIAQEKFKITPIYQVAKSFGPDHDKIFIVKVLVGKKEWGKGQGKNKQEAEQEAAATALEKINQT